MSRAERFDRVTGEESADAIALSRRIDEAADAAWINVTVEYKGWPVSARVRFLYDIFGFEQPDVALMGGPEPGAETYELQQQAVAKACEIRDEAQRRAWEEADVARSIEILKRVGRLTEIGGKWVLREEHR